VVEILGKGEAIKMEVSQQNGLSGWEFSNKSKIRCQGK
jgi:hypothetical protein